jgi:hypothetical protein
MKEILLRIPLDGPTTFDDLLEHVSYHTPSFVALICHKPTSMGGSYHVYPPPPWAAPKFYGGSTLTHGHQALVEDTSSPIVRTTWDIGAKTKEDMHYRKHRNFRRPYLSFDGLAKKTDGN